nr:unnamed protein product [Spirometra erinaceieuropaei]
MSVTATASDVRRLLCNSNLDPIDTDHVLLVTAKNTAGLGIALKLAAGAHGLNERTRILGLGRQFRIIDDDGDRYIDFKEFMKGCRDFGADLTKDEMEEIFHRIDKDGSGHLDFDEFLNALRPPMPKCRLELINKAFMKMDRTNDGYITAEDLKGVYNCTHHPKYKNGEWTEEQVFQEFLKKFEAPNEIDGKALGDRDRSSTRLNHSAFGYETEGPPATSEENGSIVSGGGTLRGLWTHFYLPNAKILGRGNDRVARETIEAWHTETTSINRCVALPTAYQALRTQLNELKSKREVRPDVDPNTGEPTTDLHVATPQIGPDEGAVINTVASTTTPADGEKRGQRDAIKTSNPARQFRSTRMRAMATNVQMPPPRRETGRLAAVTLPPALPGDYRDDPCAYAGH